MPVRKSKKKQPPKDERRDGHDLDGSATMECPKCGLWQPQTEECTGCGIIIAKFNQRKRTDAVYGHRPARQKRTWYGPLTRTRELRDYYLSQYQMLAAGLSALEATGSYYQNTKSIKDSLPFRRICERLERGDPASVGMAESPNYFPQYHVQVIAAGELTGRPETIYRDLHEILQKKVETIEGIIKQMIKPALTLLASFFILPFPILFSSGTKAYLMASLLPLMAATLFVGSGVYIYKRLMRLPKFRYQADSFKFAMPLSGTFVLNQFLQIFASLYKAGISPVEGYSVAALAVDNRYFQDLCMARHHLLKEGYSLSDVFQALGIFPNELLQFLRSGEESGKIDTSMDKYLQIAEQKFDAQMSMMTSILSTLVIIGVCLFAGYRIVTRMGQLLGG